MCHFEIRLKDNSPAISHRTRILMIGKDFPKRCFLNSPEQDEAYDEINRQIIQPLRYIFKSAFLSYSQPFPIGLGLTP